MSSTMSSTQMGTKARRASPMLLAFVVSTSFFGTAFAATNHEATYTVGNLDGFHAGAAGVVRVDDAGITFRAGSSVVDVPYARITSTTLTPRDAGAVHSRGLKVWNRRGSKKGQDLLVNFKDAAGKEQTMTLEVNESSANDIHNTLAVRAPSHSSSPVVTAKHADAPKSKTKESAAEKRQAKAKKKDAAEPQQTAKANDDAPQAAETPVQAKAKRVKANKHQEQAKVQPAEQPKTQKAEQAKEQPSEQSKSWWGDEYWKTVRNRDSWATQSAAVTK